MAGSFDDWGKGETKYFEAKGDVLTKEHLDLVFEMIKHNHGQPRERVLSFPQFKRAKELATKFEAQTISEDERLELKLLTGV